MNPITIRPATSADLPFLWDMLFESAFTTDEVRETWRSDPQPPPELVKYLDGWGRSGDAGVVALDAGGTAVGAAWYRLFTAAERGDGILARLGVPELAIAVEREHRGRRIGADLLEVLTRSAKETGYRCLMLSVDPANTHALRLYERIGFVPFDTSDPARGTSLIMQLDL